MKKSIKKIYKLLFIIPIFIVVFFIAHSALAFTGTQENISYNSGTSTFTTPNHGSVWGMTDNPFNPSWGGYGTGCVTNSGATGSNRPLASASTCRSQQNANANNGGHFMIQYTGTGTSADPQYYGLFDIDNSGVVTVFNLASGITTISTPIASSTVDSPVSFTGFYTNIDTYDQVCEIANDGTDSINYAPICKPIPLTNGSGLPFSFTVPMTTGHLYDFKMYLHDTVNNTNSAQTSLVTFTVSGGTIGTEPIALETCASIVTDFAGCIHNFFIWAFVPTPDSLAQFSNLTLENSKPFSYLWDLPNFYSDLFNTSAISSLDLGVDVLGGHVTFLNATTCSGIAWCGTMRTLLSALLYLATAWFIIKKVGGIHDQGHQTV